MTEEQRDYYLLLLMTGREREALAYRDQCEGNTAENILEEVADHAEA